MLHSVLHQQHTISYRVTGNGYPVLLVHGFGEEANVWDDMVSVLSKKYRLIIPDLPGSGNSELIADMSIEGMAETLQIILQAEKIKHCILIGHSMGGYITLAFADKYPDQLTGFGLFHSTAYADSPEKIATRRKGIAFIQEHGAFAFLKTATPNLFSPVTKEENPELVEKQIESLTGFTAESLVAYYEAMINRPDRTAVLKHSAVPVLFIIGNYDQAVSPDDGFKQAHLPEKSYIHLLSRSGHMGMLEETGESIRILESFLQDTVKP